MRGFCVLLTDRDHIEDVQALTKRAMSLSITWAANAFNVFEYFQQKSLRIQAGCTPINIKESPVINVKDSRHDFIQLDRYRAKIMACLAGSGMQLKIERMESVAT